VFKIESFKKGILFSGFFNFAAKLISFSNNIFIAFYFGSQIKMDIYFYVLATINMVVSFISSLDQAVLIPESMRIREEEGIHKSMSFLNSFFYFYVFIGAAIIFAVFLRPILIYSTLSKFDINSLKDNINILYLMTPLFLLILISEYLINILISFKYFTVPMITRVINSLLSIIFIVGFHNILDVLSITFGLVSGYIINIILLLIIMKFSLHWKFVFSLIKLNKKLIKNVFYSQSGNITTSLKSYIPMYLLSGLSSGVITVFNYAKKVTEMPNDLVTNHFCNVSLIKLNELYSKKEYSRYNDVFFDVTDILIFILLPISGLFFLYSEEIISIFFRRGEFNSASVLLTSSFTRYLGFLLPCMAVNSMVGRLFISSRKLAQSFLYQIMYNIFSCLAFFLLIQRYGINGYLFTIIAIYLLEVFTGFFLCKFFLPIIKYSKIILCFLKYTLLNAVIILILYYINKYLNFNIILRLLSGSLIYFFLVILVNFIFKFNSKVNNYLMMLLKKT
jgi:peptidoglycan biosynthesis protein MviN/MurJ (putative lipid II flippase)